DPRATLVSLLGSHYAVMRDRLEQPERDLLCQSAVQGIEFAPDVAQAVQRLVGWQGPPVRMLLPRLERRGLVKSGGDDRWAQWSFSSPLVQGARYEALSLPDRRA